MKEILIIVLVLGCLLLVSLMIVMTIITMKSIIDETKRHKVSKRIAGGAETKREVEE